MHARAAAAISSACIALLASRLAHASGPLELRWDAPAECPSESEVRAAVLQRLGASVEYKPISAHAVVHKDGDGWKISLTTEQSGETGERSLEGRTCAAVAAATSVILALTLDRAAQATPVAPPVASASPVPIRPVPPPSSSVLPRAPPPSVDGRSFVRAGFALGAGVMGPGPSAGLTVALGARASWLTLELAMTTFFPRSIDLPGVAGKGGDFWLFSLGPTVCGAFLRSPTLRLGGCVGAELSRMSATGYGVSEPSSRATTFVSTVASVRFGVRLGGPIWFFALADLVVPLRRPQFVLENAGTIFQLSPLGGRTSMGLELHF